MMPPATMMPPSRYPPIRSSMQSNLLLAYYGDDFTGSTDVMESLTQGGVETVLFVDPPTPEQLAAYPNLRAFGVAGTSRTMSPESMEQSLPPIFSALASSGAAIVHYKICSTFDSSSTIGSIGRAIDLGSRRFPGSPVPLVVGAPVLGRYVAFGNLFARSGLDTAPYRLDRHPTMLQHPVTPMNEADLRLHLKTQTEKSVRLVDALMLDAADGTAEKSLAASDDAIVLFDTMTDTHLATIGRLIWSSVQGSTPRFVVGSSGVEYALTARWRQLDFLKTARPFVSPGPAEKVAVVSGSCSPVTDRQIAWALENGFQEIALDIVSMITPETAASAMDQAVASATEILDRRCSVILHSCRGPSDDRIEDTKQCVARNSEHRPADTGRVIGSVLGKLMRQIVSAASLKRVAVTGGDTSGFVARELGIEALEMVHPLAPGSPLCRARSRWDEIDGCEITFKGGQVGKDSFFGSLVRGKQ